MRRPSEKSSKYQPSLGKRSWEELKTVRWTWNETAHRRDLWKMGIFRPVDISLLISVVLVSENVPHSMRDLTNTFYLLTIFDVLINKGWWSHQLTIIVWENVKQVMVFQVDISQSVVEPFSPISVIRLINHFKVFIKKVFLNELYWRNCECFNLQLR